MANYQAILKILILLVGQTFVESTLHEGLNLFRGEPTLPNITIVNEDKRLHSHMEGVIKTLDPRARNAIRKIDGTGRRLLALKYYLRKRGDMRSGWAWSMAQIIRFKRSSEYGRALLEVEKVKQKFAELNPGYTLKVYTEVRTVADQIRIWNQAPSTGAAGSALLASCMKLISDSTVFHDTADKKGIAKFQRFLLDAKVTQVPTAAVPGLSQHGQLRAFDFVIWQGDKIAAGTDAGSIGAVWERSGWSAKLKDAVTQASDRFSGPLESPREPWHYSYIPEKPEPAATEGTAKAKSSKPSHRRSRRR